MSSKKDVLVVGFGAVGAVYSYLLQRGGKAHVTCVARSNYDETQAHGIHIQSKKYGDIKGWKPDRLFKSIADAAADRPYSYVIVTTKALPDITRTSSLLAPLLSPDNPHPLPTFVLLQNGLSVERDLYQAIKGLGKGEPSIISTALWVGTNLLEGNVVDHSVAERVSIGIYRPSYKPDVQNTPEEAAVLEDFAGLLKPSGSSITIFHEIQRIKFRKVFWNAALGSCATLARYPLKAFFLDPAMEAQVSPTLRAIMLEILAIGRAMGFDEEALPSGLVDADLQHAAGENKSPHSTFKPSMLLDLELGHPLEVDVIVGELVRRGKELHVDIPRLDLIYTLLSVIQHKIRSEH